jgi:hypothetical protein
VSNNTSSVRGVDDAVEMINMIIYSPVFSDGSSFKLGKTVCEGIRAGIKWKCKTSVF